MMSNHFQLQSYLTNHLKPKRESLQKSESFTWFQFSNLSFNCATNWLCYIIQTFQATPIESICINNVKCKQLAVQLQLLIHSIKQKPQSAISSFNFRTSLFLSSSIRSRCYPFDFALRILHQSILFRNHCRNSTNGKTKNNEEHSRFNR